MKNIQLALNQYIDSLPNSPLKDAISYALLGEGKRVRPLLAFNLLQSKGMDPAPYLSALISVELIHTYSLIHDDLPAMDDDTLRRGKPTVHMQFDEATAILAGDALLTDSFNLITKNPSLTDQQKVQIVQILSKKAGSLGMVLGQIKDIESENKSITIEDLNQMYALKTANLIQASLMLGAVIAAPDELSTYEKLGYYIGLIFQIQDDLIEHLYTSEKIGKSKSDITRNKPTYVSLLGLEQTQQKLKDYTNSLNELIYALSLQNTNLHEQIKALLTREK